MHGGKQRNQTRVKPSEVEAKVACIRNDINEALKEKVRLRISKDQFIIEGKTEENAKMVESVAIGVAKTDALMAKLYRFLLQSATNTFIDLHFLKVTEAESQWSMFYLAGVGTFSQAHLFTLLHLPCRDALLDLRASDGGWRYLRCPRGQGKLQEWFLNVCGHELAEEIEDEDKICYFCLWHAEFLWKFNQMADELLVWWPRNSDYLDDAAKELRNYYFEGKLEQCWVQVEKIELPQSDDEERRIVEAVIRPRRWKCIYCGKRFKYSR
ncbi:Hypothetical predicted protein, partial [Cloeon dipterum]